MNTPITTENILALFGVVITVVSLLKAIEWGIDKITSAHDKNQKIDDNAESIEDYKIKTDARLDVLEKKVDAGHKKAFESLGDMKDFINQAVSESNKETLALLNAHKKEYMEQIESVKDDITELKAEYQSKTAVIELKISSLEKKQEVHNNLISRVYGCESSIKLQEEQIKVANHRIEDLEKKA